MTTYFDEVLASQGLPYKVKVIFPYDETIDKSFSTGAWITMIIIFTIVLLGIAGTLLEYVHIFDKPDSLPTMKTEERLTGLGKVFFSFSFMHNIEKMFSVSDRGDENLKVINGIRVFSICWVIIGHSFMNVMGAPITNIVTALSVTEKWYFALVPGGFFAVDVFFYLSGFLTFYLLTQRMYPKGGRDNYPMIYFHRWYRLAFPSAFCILL